jgi:hypothetical protein
MICFTLNSVYFSIYDRKTNDFKRKVSSQFHVKWIFVTVTSRNFGFPIKVTTSRERMKEIACVFNK